ncbi:MAG TPA: family membership [Candidatus Angelobacter sp.]
MRREHATDLTLPAPTGHFAVGRATYAWVNDAQRDELAPSPGAKREVLVWIWYPSAGSQPATPAEYLPAPWRAALARSSGVLMSQILTRDPSMVHGHSSSDSGISLEQRSYPVVIMRAGGGALTTDFTTLAEDLASHGYVVVGFDAPYRTAVVVLPDGRVVERAPANNPETLSADEQDRLIKKLLLIWSGDTQFVVDQLGRLNAADPAGKFTGRLDMQRLGMFGHSFGGATALQFCHDDPRCKAGIDIDGDPFGGAVGEGITQPFFFLLSDHGDLSAPDTREVFAKIQSIYDRLPNGRLLLTIPRTNHFSFSDQILLKSHYVIRLLELFHGGPDARRGLTITTAYVHTFFDVYLKNGSPSLLDNLRQACPEVQIPVPKP